MFFHQLHAWFCGLGGLLQFDAVLQWETLLDTDITAFEIRTLLRDRKDHTKWLRSEIWFADRDALAFLNPFTSAGPNNVVPTVGKIQADIPQCAIS